MANHNDEYNTRGEAGYVWVVVVVVGFVVVSCKRKNNSVGVGGRYVIRLRKVNGWLLALVAIQLRHQSGQLTWESNWTTS